MKALLSALHFLPQVPQFSLLSRLTHLPSQTASRPLLHFWTQLPVEQEAVPSAGTLHLTPQPPQFSMVERLTQPISEPQLDRPESHS